MKALREFWMNVTVWKLSLTNILMKMDRINRMMDMPYLKE